MAQEGALGPSIYMQATDPIDTSPALAVRAGDFWYDGTSLRLRTTIRTWVIIGP